MPAKRMRYIRRRIEIMHQQTMFFGSDSRHADKDKDGDKKEKKNKNNTTTSNNNNNKNDLRTFQREFIVKFVDDYLQSDGLFILRVLSSNTSDFVCTELIQELWKYFNHQRKYVTSKKAALGTSKSVSNYHQKADENDDNDDDDDDDENNNNDDDDDDDDDVDDDDNEDDADFYKSAKSGNDVELGRKGANNNDDDDQLGGGDEDKIRGFWPQSVNTNQRGDVETSMSKSRRLMPQQLYPPSLPPTQRISQHKQSSTGSDIHLATTTRCERAPSYNKQHHQHSIDEHHHQKRPSADSFASQKAQKKKPLESTKLRRLFKVGLKNENNEMPSSSSPVNINRYSFLSTGNVVSNTVAAVGVGHASRQSSLSSVAGGGKVSYVNGCIVREANDSSALGGTMIRPPPQQHNNNNKQQLQTFELRSEDRKLASSYQHVKNANEKHNALEKDKHQQENSNNNNNNNNNNENGDKAQSKHTSMGNVLHESSSVRHQHHQKESGGRNATSVLQSNQRSVLINESNDF